MAFFFAFGIVAYGVAEATEEIWSPEHSLRATDDKILIAFPFAVVGGIIDVFCVLGIVGSMLPRSPDE